MNNPVDDFCKPKTDQLNAEDLIDAPRTVRITRVEFKGGEQSCHISFEGDGGKPYKPGKSMGRVMRAAWGKDHHRWVGESMTLYCDPEVKMKGMKVGGIRISHMTRLKRPLSVKLTATRGVFNLFTVEPIRDDGRPVKPELSPEEKAAAAKGKADEIISQLAAAETTEAIDKVFEENGAFLDRLEQNYLADYERVTDARDFKRDSLANQ